MGEGPWRQQGPNSANSATQAPSAREWERERQRQRQWDANTERRCLYMIIFPVANAAAPLLYITTQCDDCSGVWCVSAGVGVCWLHFRKRMGTYYAHLGLAY